MIAWVKRYKKKDKIKPHPLGKMKQNSSAGEKAQKDNRDTNVRLCSESKEGSIVALLSFLLVHFFGILIRSRPTVLSSDAITASILALVIEVLETREAECHGVYSDEGSMTMEEARSILGTETFIEA